MITCGQAKKVVVLTPAADGRSLVVVLFVGDNAYNGRLVSAWLRVES